MFSAKLPRYLLLLLLSVTIVRSEDYPYFPPIRTSISWSTNGNLLLQWNSRPGVNYFIRSTTNLSAPWGPPTSYNTDQALLFGAYLPEVYFQVAADPNSFRRASIHLVSW